MPRVSKLVTYANETLENGERGAPSDLFVSVLVSDSEYVQVLYTYMHDIQIQSLATHNSSPGFVAHIPHLLVFFPHRLMIEIHDRAQLGDPATGLQKKKV